MEKIQINVNATRIQSQDFERNVENVMIRCNELIDQFHNFQPWKKIAFIEDFIKLCQDPAGLFDIGELARHCGSPRSDNFAVDCHILVKGRLKRITGFVRP